MLDKDIKVLRVSEDALWTQQGKSDPQIRVDFLVGDHGPFTERIRKADYSAAAREAALNKFAKEVR